MMWARFITSITVGILHVCMGIAENVSCGSDQASCEVDMASAIPTNTLQSRGLNMLQASVAMAAGSNLMSETNFEGRAEESDDEGDGDNHDALKPKAFPMFCKGKTRHHFKSLLFAEGYGPLPGPKKSSKKVCEQFCSDQSDCIAYEWMEIVAQCFIYWSNKDSCVKECKVNKYQGSLGFCGLKHWCSWEEQCEFYCDGKQANEQPKDFPTCKGKKLGKCHWNSCDVRPSVDEGLYVKPGKTTWPLPWTPPVLTSHLLYPGKKCSKNDKVVVLKKWDWSDIGHLPGLDYYLSMCAGLVDEKGAENGCTSGMFHFPTKISAPWPFHIECRCAIDECKSAEEFTEDPAFNVYILSSDVVNHAQFPPPLTILGLHFPLAPPVPYKKIWDEKATDEYKVAENDCDPGYKPILDVAECRKAGKALKINSWPRDDIPMLNGMAWRMFNCPVDSFKLGDIELLDITKCPSPYPVYPFYPGCLVASGANRGAKKAWNARDGLWFNPDDPSLGGTQVKGKDHVFIKLRVCKASS